MVLEMVRAFCIKAVIQAILPDRHGEEGAEPKAGEIIISSPSLSVLH